MKDMVNNFCRENVAKLTFGDISSELTSTGYPSAEVSFAFTPTTLAALESTFVSFGESVGVERVMESDSSSAQVNWDQSTSYSGMSDCSNDSEDNSNSMDWTAGGKRSRKCDSSGESTQMMGDSRPPRRLPGPRPSCRDEEMTPEELERRRRRRERNKTAAAKCRQRRVDQTNVLLQETKGLEEEAQKLEKEIKALEQLKHQLEFVLDAHKPVCKADVNASFFKTEPQSIPTSIPASRPTTLPIATTTAPQVISNTISTSAANQLFLTFLQRV